MIIAIANTLAAECDTLATVTVSDSGDSIALLTTDGRRLTVVCTLTGTLKVRSQDSRWNGLTVGTMRDRSDDIALSIAHLIGA